MIVNLFEQQVGQQLVQQQILLAEADEAGHFARTATTWCSFLHQGQAGQVLFPEWQVHRAGQVCGADRAAVSTCRLPNLKRAYATTSTIQRLRAYVTAGRTVSDEGSARAVPEERHEDQV